MTGVPSNRQERPKRVMVIVKASDEPEAGKMPSEQLLAAMRMCNDERSSARLGRTRARLACRSAPDAFVEPTGGSAGMALWRPATVHPLARGGSAPSGRNDLHARLKRRTAEESPQ